MMRLDISYNKLLQGAQNEIINYEPKNKRQSSEYIL